MKNRSPLGAVAASFAHLLGRPTPAAASTKAEDEDMEEDEEAKGAEDSDEEDESDDKKDAKAKKAKKAKEDDEDETDAENDDSDEDGDDDEDTDKDGAKKAGRKAERARCAAIFGAKSAGTRPDLAAHLAFNTDLSAKAAVALLDAAAIGHQPTKGRRSLDERMSAVKTPNPGQDGGQAPDANTAEGLAAKMRAIYDAGTGKQ